MLQQRPYRAGQDFEDVCLEIKRCSGTQFDPEVVSAFLSILAPVRELLRCVQSTSSSPLTLIKSGAEMFCGDSLKGKP
jgi:HD-GYP domain-containing protein (c-di-GMP phosphodiesterase class II)